jgi:hypothetical protein
MNTLVVLKHGQLEAMKLACKCFHDGTTLQDFEMYEITDQLTIARTAGIDAAELLMALRYFDSISDTLVQINPVVAELMERDRIRNGTESQPEASESPAG